MAGLYLPQDALGEERTFPWTQLLCSTAGLPSTAADCSTSLTGSWAPHDSSGLQDMAARKVGPIPSAVSKQWRVLSREVM